MLLGPFQLGIMSIGRFLSTLILTLLLLSPSGEKSGWGIGPWEASISGPVAYHAQELARAPGIPQLAPASGSLDTSSSGAGSAPARRSAQSPTSESIATGCGCPFGRLLPVRPVAERLPYHSTAPPAVA